MPDVLVLCYHAVSERWPAALSVTPAAFERQIGELVQRGYRGVGFSEAVAATSGERLLAVTFDDGFRSVLELARPTLDRHGIPGTLFVPTDWPGQARPMQWAGIDRWLGTPYEPELGCVSWDELRMLDAAGWEIGSHTCSHPHLTSLGDEDLARELAESKARIEAELGRCTSLAYPYGSVDERVERATAAAGYACACAIPRILYRPRPLCWPRTPIFHVDTITRFRLKVSPAVRRMRRSRVVGPFERARVARDIPAERPRGAPS